IQGSPQSPQYESTYALLSHLKLNHYADGEFCFALPKVREPNTAAATTAGSFRSAQVVGSSRGSACAGIVLRQAVVTPGRRDAATACEIRYIRVAIAPLRPPGDVLFRHVLERYCSVLHRSPLAGILGEIGRTGRSI